MSTIHLAVMLEETMLALDVQPGGSYVDATLGGATHTEALLKRSEPDGHVYSFDVNPKALLAAAQRLTASGDRWAGIEANFRFLDRELEAAGVMPGSIDGILCDLGFSSDEMADPSTGLSFQLEGPLDMRLGPKSNDDGLTASDIVNTWKPNEIETMIRNFGEEKFASRIVDEIVKARKIARITRTTELASLIKQAVPQSYEQGRIHPATRTFQALRIAVNDELEALKDFMNASHRMLKPGGRLAIISFHSLEDRIVKHAFLTDEWEALTKRPAEASPFEVQANPRARSAKLRVAIKK
ncbi:16S rRNA (cytosine(1402)-N(4))-methyltransferase RsmH [Candidatus Uhrbacteria bacterium]|nr:16S rRNA (cytosine(1402)-N(4))-methyltransferase RsmH [Candidatus Uhrbacteria bacterium]